MDIQSLMRSYEYAISTAPPTLPNPTEDIPRLPPQRLRSSHSRSPSRSPNRGRARNLDPVLRDLSPTKTLRALSFTPGAAEENALVKGFETASQGERALAVKAAQACADLRSWANEIESWEWSGTFETPEPARKKQRTLDTNVSPSSRDAEQQEQIEEEYWGSLPAREVQALEQRVEHISDELDGIDVEELKDFVLLAHSQAGMRDTALDDSIGIIGAATDLKRLDDFTAIVTATILQALPYLSRLTRLLNTWTVRLSVLRSSASFERDLEQVRKDLDRGWSSLGVAAESSEGVITADDLEATKSIISSQLYALGKRLDRFLDELEGRQDTVPDAWIDAFEEMEQQYGAWVVQAERKVVNEPLRMSSMVAEQEQNVRLTPGAEDAAREPIEQYSGRSDSLEQSATVAMDAQTLDAGAPYFEYASRSRSLVGTTPPQSSSRTMTSTTTRTIMSGPATTTTTVTAELFRDSGSYHDTSDDHPAHVSQGAEFSESPTRLRARHIPIMVDYNDPNRALGGAKDTTLPANELPAPSTTQDTPHIHRSISQPLDSVPDVKRRAAFLNGDIEKGDSLLKSKPAPIVRPFEHASNAFTRLFKRDRDDAAKDKQINKRSVSGNEGARNKTVPTHAGIQMSTDRQRPATGNASVNRMEHMDMVRVPTRTSTDSNRTETKSLWIKASKRDSKTLVYGDLVSVPISESFPGHEHVPSLSRRERSESQLSQAESRRSRPRTPKQEPIRSYRPRSDSADVVALRVRTSMDTHSINASTSTLDRFVPETYRPTGLSSPFASPVEPEQEDFPANWPLSASASPVRESSSIRDYLEDQDYSAVEKKLPRQALPSSFFEDVFIGEMAVSPESKTHTSQRREIQRHDELLRPATAPSSQAAGMAGLAGEHFRNAFGRKDMKHLAPMNSSFPRPVSIVPEEAESSSDTDSTFAIEDAGIPADMADITETADFPEEEEQTAIVAAPAMLKRLPLLRSQSTPMPSPMVLQLQVPRTAVSDTESAEIVDGKIPHIKRASLASIEVFKRSELKSVDIIRRSSSWSPVVNSEAWSSPRTSNEMDEKSKDADSPAGSSPSLLFPSPPRAPFAHSSLRDEVAQDSGQTDEALPEHATSERDTPSPTTEREASFNQVVPKQRNKPTLQGAREHGTNGKKTSAPLKPGEDNFDRHVSEVLERVHAPIRFKSGTGADTPVGAMKLRAKTGKAQKNLTLAPADPVPRKPAGTESGVKLYHLTQAGRAEPIKLFVRLVGEGERVMVRVGGGWADLADFLRQYADHHGSRTVSESILELQTAPAGNGNGNALAKRTFSGPARPESVKGRSPVTPTFGSSSRLWLEDSASDQSSGRSSPTFSPQLDSAFGSKTAVPRSLHSASRPSTATGYATTSRPRSRSERLRLDADSGTSGTKTRDDLAEQKAKWVEGMIEAAKKSASAEKSREDREKYFADMGRVGGTRRVVLKDGVNGVRHARLGSE